MTGWTPSEEAPSELLFREQALQPRTVHNWLGHLETLAHLELQILPSNRRLHSLVRYLRAFERRSLIFVWITFVSRKYAFECRQGLCASKSMTTCTIFSLPLVTKPVRPLWAVVLSRTLQFSVCTKKVGMVCVFINVIVVKILKFKLICSLVVLLCIGT